MPDRRTFTDNQGDEWLVVVTYGHVVEVERQCAVNLPSLFNENLKELGEFWGSPAKVVSVSACLCDTQLEERGLSAEDFAYRMGGESIEGAADAILWGTIDFFPPHDQPRAQGLYTRMIRIGKMAAKELPNQAFREMDSMTDADWLKLLSSQSGNAQESPALTPGR